MSNGQRKKSPAAQSQTQAWSQGASRLIEQGKLMWLLGEGMNAVLKAQSRGVNPPDEEALVDTVFGWIKRVGAVVPGDNPFAADLRRDKVVAVSAPGLKKELSPTGPPQNLMLVLALRLYDRILRRIGGRDLRTKKYRLSGRYAVIDQISRTVFRRNRADCPPSS